MKRIALAVAAVTLLTAGVASATQPAPQPAHQGGVKITAPVTMSQWFYNNTNYAYGEDNEAVQAMGAIVGDVEVGGRVDMYQSFEYQNNFADGKRNTAHQLNGSIVGAPLGGE